jgi:ring-1,2-phenylacetyl-CoA epoxidase subunit PaaD
MDEIIIYITPTYTGCPAMDMISANINIELAMHGFKNIRVITVLSPAWTTDWMSEEGKAKLKEYGISTTFAKATGLSY